MQWNQQSAITGHHLSFQLTAASFKMSPTISTRLITDQSRALFKERRRKRKMSMAERGEKERVENNTTANQTHWKYLTPTPTRTGNLRVQGNRRERIASLRCNVTALSIVFKVFPPLLWHTLKIVMSLSLSYFKKGQQRKGGSETVTCQISIDQYWPVYLDQTLIKQETMVVKQYSHSALLLHLCTH